MLKQTVAIIFALLHFSANAVVYSGCTDPNYIAYVEKRISFYEKLDKERYEKALSEIGFTGVHSVENIALSARFDSKEVALRNIKAFEEHQQSLVGSVVAFFMGQDDALHHVQIAKGWLALQSGNEDEAISHLHASTKVKGSPVLGSFGPDVTLIRELYQRGHKAAVLDYLGLVETFWNTDSAKQHIAAWRQLAENDCPIQFQFYDTTSIVELGL